MSTTTICTSCFRALRLQARLELRSNQISKTSAILNRRQPFSGTPQHRQTPKPTEDTSKSFPPPPPSTSKPPDAFASLASSLRQNQSFQNVTEPYLAYGSTEALFAECAKQCAYTIPSRNASPPEPAPQNAAGEDVGVGEGWWYRPRSEGGLGLDVTFNTWAQVMYLHMYALTVRLRMFPAEHAKIWHQQLLDHFFYASEDRMAMWHGMSARSVRNKYLKDLLLQWRGVLFSYDEGLVKGDAVLAGAVWRNVFKANPETSVDDLAVVTGYLRQQLQVLDKLSDENVASGQVKFGRPEQIKTVLEKESPLMREEFSAEELKAVENK